MRSTLMKCVTQDGSYVCMSGSGNREMCLFLMLYDAIYRYVFLLGLEDTYLREDRRSHLVLEKIGRP